LSKKEKNNNLNLPSDFNSMKLIKENIYAILSQLSFFLPSVILTLLFPLLLSVQDYGIIALFLTLFSALTFIFDFGIMPATVLIAKKQSYFSTLFYLRLFISLLLCTFLFYSSDLIANIYGQPQLSDLIKVGSVALFFTTFAFFFESAFISLKKAFKGLIIQLINHFGKLLSLALLSFGLIGIAYGFLIPSFLAFIVGLFMGRRYIRGFYLTDEIKEHVKSGFILESVDAVFLYFDVIVLGLFLSIEEISFYKLAILWASGFQFVMPFSHKVLTVFHATSKNFERVLKDFIKLAFLFISIGVLIANKTAFYIISFIYKPYSTSGILLSVLCFLGFEFLLNYFSYILLVGSNKISLYSKLRFLSAIVYLLFLAFVGSNLNLFDVIIFVVGIRLFLSLLIFYVANKEVNMKLFSIVKKFILFIILLYFISHALPDVRDLSTFLFTLVAIPSSSLLISYFFDLLPFSLTRYL